jgi:hypothetical protein
MSSCHSEKVHVGIFEACIDTDDDAYARETMGKK